MIIDTFLCKELTREMTDLMSAYNMNLLSVRFDDFDDVLVVSYRANRGFENNRFKELLDVLLDEQPKGTFLVWTSVEPVGEHKFTVGKLYPFERESSSMVMLNDNNGLKSIIAIGESVFGNNQLEEH